MSEDDLRARIEALAAKYEADARHEGYGGELWSTTAAALHALLDEPVPEPVTADEVALLIHEKGGTTPAPLRPDRCGTCRESIASARALLERFHVTRRAEQ